MSTMSTESLADAKPARHVATAARPLHVLVATPAGGVGQGGIDRVMASLGEAVSGQRRSDLHLRFGATRGEGHIVFSLWHMLVFVVRMLVLRLSGRLDLVHLNLASSGSTWRKLVLAAWARLLGVPYTLHLHGAEYHQFWNPDHKLRSALIAWLFSGAARILVLGSVWKRFVLSRLPTLEDRLVIVPNATARPSLAHLGGGDRVHILFLGRIGARKGVPELGDALYRLRDDARWRATIAGDGYVAEARAKAAEMGLVGRVVLPGWVGPDAVAELIANADILVLPSYHENLPISVIEAMAAGLAVVATPVGAVEDIITDSETGLLVPPGDVDALTVALKKLIDSPALRLRLGTAAREVHRQRLDIVPYVETMSGVWHEAVATR
jgi:glycosyltransferase involved in cell wall biosynthesis